MGPQFNPEMLSLARGARGYSQAALSEHMAWTQSKASKIEHGLVAPSVADIERLAELLSFPVDLFYHQSASSGFGSCCQYHRKRTTTPIKLVNRLHDEVNIRRMQVSRLIKGVDLKNEPNFPELDIDSFGSPEEVADELRATWRLPRGPVQNLTATIEASGGLVVTMGLGTPKIDAVSQRAPSLPPLFFLDRGKPADRCRYTLAHELGHIIMHAIPSPNAEEEADRFAAEFLMPEDAIKHELKNLTIARAAALKLKWRVAMQALIRRAKDLGAITSAKYKSLCVRISQLGFRKNEPNPIEPEYPRTIKSVIDMYIRERNYSAEEVARVMLCSPAEFEEVFVSSDPGHRLRLVK